MSTQGKVSFTIKNHCAEVTIDNPPVNSLGRSMLGSLGSTMDVLNSNESVRVIIITGAGDKFFVGGADINEFQGLNQESGAEHAALFQSVFAKLHSSPKIVIAAINGYALGGGCELTLSCDLRIAAENAKLGQPEVNYSVIAGAGGTQKLPRIVGLGRAKELVMTGDIIDAQEAFQMGLVNRIVPLNTLMDEARKMAAKISSKGPIAVRLTKEACNLALELPLAEGLKKEVQFFGISCGTEDKEEGIRAFLEKRPPNFKGK